MEVLYTYMTKAVSLEERLLFGRADVKGRDFVEVKIKRFDFIMRL